MEALRVDIKEEAANSHTESSPLDANVPSSSNSASSCGSVEDHMRSLLDHATVEEINRILGAVNSFSDIAKIYFYLKLPISGCNQPNPPQNANLSNQVEMNHASVWISTHLELDPNVCLRKDEVYQEYRSYCERHLDKFLNTADFGKAMKRSFPAVKPRRLGQRGQSKYCYGGLKKKQKWESPRLTEMTFEETDDDSKSSNLIAVEETHCQFLIKYLSNTVGRPLSSLEEAVNFLTANTGNNNVFKESSPSVHSSVRRTNSQMSGVPMSPMSDASGGAALSALVRPEARRTIETGLVRASSSPSHQRSDLCPMTPNFSTPPGRSSQPTSRVQQLITDGSGASSPHSITSPFRPVTSSGHGVELPHTPTTIPQTLLPHVVQQLPPHQLQPSLQQQQPTLTTTMAEAAASYYSLQSGIKVQQQQSPIPPAQLQMSLMPHSHHPPNLSPHLPLMRQQQLQQYLTGGSHVLSQPQQNSSPILLMSQPQQTSIVKCEAVQPSNTPPQAHMPNVTGTGNSSAGTRRFFADPPPHPAPLPPVGAGSSPYSSNTLMRTAAPPPPSVSGAGEETVINPKRVLKRQQQVVMTHVDNESKWQRLLEHANGPDVAAVEDDAFTADWNPSALSPMPANDVESGVNTNGGHGFEFSCVDQTSSDLDDIFYGELPSCGGPDEGTSSSTGAFGVRTSTRLEVGSSPCASPTHLAMAPFSQHSLIKAEPPGTPKSAERPGRHIGSLSQRLDDQQQQQQLEQESRESTDILVSMSAATRMRGELNTPVPLRTPTPSMTPGSLSSQ